MKKVENMWKNDRESVKTLGEIDKVKISKENLKKYLSADDIVYSAFSFGGTGALLVCVDGLVNEQTVDESILAVFHRVDAFKHCDTQKKAVALMNSGFKSHAASTQVFKLSEVIEGVLSANFAVVFEDENTAFLFDIKGFEKRSIEPSDNENTMKGSKDVFTEPLRVNTAIVRRHIRSHNLAVKQIEVGKVTSCTVALTYMENMADASLVARIEKVLKGIDCVGVVSLGQIEEALSADGFSLFPKLLSTERADKFCANVLNGRVGIIVDGYPVTFIAPACFSMFFQTPDDYSLHFVFMSFIRMIRYACFSLSLSLPAIYLAVVSFHGEIIPARLAQSIMSAKLGVPFSAFFEIFFMLIAFEILIEAGLRLPQGMGQTVSIVAGLVVGDSAINAKLVSPAVVMVMAVSGITCFVIPYQDFANPIRLIRLVFIFAAQLFSLFGVVVVTICTVVYLNSIESFGLPYLAPFSQYSVKSWFKDTFLRGRYSDKKVYR